MKCTTDGTLNTLAALSLLLCVIVLLVWPFSYIDASVFPPVRDTSATNLISIEGELCIGTTHRDGKYGFTVMDTLNAKYRVRHRTLAICFAILPIAWSVRRIAVTKRIA